MCACMHTPTDVCGWGRWRADRCLVSDTPGERDSLSFFLFRPRVARARAARALQSLPFIRGVRRQIKSRRRHARAVHAGIYTHTH